MERSGSAFYGFVSFSNKMDRVRIQVQAEDEHQSTFPEGKFKWNMKVLRCRIIVAGGAALRSCTGCFENIGNLSEKVIELDK